ncbi:MAG: hypothetical protein WCJ31_16630 [Planctomycetia bacterium]
MHLRARMLFPILTLVLLVGACGCSSLVRERLADNPLPGDTHSAGSDETDTGIRAVSVKTIQRVKDGPESPRLPSPDDTWLERQRFIFARAWQEMCRDMNYESIDSFQELAPEANREVRMMREDLAGAEGTVTTTGRRPRTP